MCATALTQFEVYSVHDSSHTDFMLGLEKLTGNSATLS